MQTLSIDYFKQKSIILDTCILIDLDKKNLLENVLVFFRENSIQAFFPESYEYEWKSGEGLYKNNLSKIEYYRNSGLLSNIAHDSRSIAIREKLKQYPLDDGELNCFSIAETYDIAIGTNDKLPVLSYMTLKKEYEIKHNSIGPDEMLNFVNNPVASTHNGMLPVLSSKDIKCLYDRNEIRNEPYQRVFFKPKQWLTTNPNNQAIANKWFPGDNEQIKKSYLMIGALFASFYACEANTPKRDRWKWNLGLKIKSSTHNRVNPIFCKVDRYRGKPWFEYSPLAYNALRKYLYTCSFMDKYIRNNFNEGSPYFGPMDPVDLREAQGFTKKFRNLYETFLVYI